jgi:CHAT domain
VSGLMGLIKHQTPQITEGFRVFLSAAPPKRSNYAWLRTRCDVAVTMNDPVEFLGTLGLMKGRIRQSRAEIPESILNRHEPIVREALAAGYPAAYFALVEDAMSVLAKGRTIALLDQIAVAGNGLWMGAVILGPHKRLWLTNSGLDEVDEYDPRVDLRGRGRGSRISLEVEQLLQAMPQHVKRSHWVVKGDLTATTAETRASLSSWEKELSPALTRLGELFFPSNIIDAFRELGVEHVILAIDPLFARVPYSALVGAHGPIVDEPWTLSVVTASTELVRTIYRRDQRGTDVGPIQWFGPDRMVNEEVGGDRELENMKKHAPVVAYREEQATRAQLLETLKGGRWCHFRGHGCWTGRVDTSGPVLAGNEILSSGEFGEESGTPGFLFTAACLTGFGEAVGVEVFGSIVDYDRANLLGAVLTAWPIHGEAAAVFTSFFYEELSKSHDVAKCLKQAAQRCREVLPHVCLWGPFGLVGDWEAGDLIERKPTSEVADKK